VERTGAEALVVDSYRATPDLLAGLRPSVGCLAVVDDLADRQLDADLVVNGAVGAAGLPYQAREGTRLLLGPRYALLDPDFADPPAGEGGDRVDRALVALGGGLHAGALRVALTALDGALEGATLDVIVGPFADAAPLGSLVSRNRMAVHRAVADPRPLMLAADLAVSGGGVTLLELAATATPAVAVVLADNQAPGVEGLVRAGAVRSAGRASDPHLAARLSREVHALATDPEERGELGRRARALVDGRGASRAARAVLDALAAVRAAAC
jgi:spore coat polysaccharide biosynthesis predicted glycosyltransferase SpsG